MKTLLVVSPVYNEEQTLAAVLGALQETPGIDEVLVVSDGSTDGTATVARAMGVTTVELRRNHGKGMAMAAGVAHTGAPVILFVDGDIGGLAPDLLGRLIAPVVAGRLAMHIGVRQRPPVVAAFHRRFGPLLSGIRCLRREVFASVPAGYLRGYRVETALNWVCRRLALPELHLLGLAHGAADRDGHHDHGRAGVRDIGGRAPAAAAHQGLVRRLRQRFAPDLPLPYRAPHLGERHVDRVPPEGQRDQRPGLADTEAHGEGEDDGGADQGRQQGAAHLGAGGAAPGQRRAHAGEQQQRHADGHGHAVEVGPAHAHLHVAQRLHHQREDGAHQHGEGEQHEQQVVDQERALAAHRLAPVATQPGRSRT